MGVIMKDHEIKVLDEDDHIFVKTLSNIGMSRNIATTMAYLMNVDKASSREIEISTGLRQPEISLATRFMRNQLWVNVRSEKRHGKGRPMEIYCLVTPVDKIISYYEDKIHKKSQATISAIEKLKAMSKTMPLTFLK